MGKKTTTTKPTTVKRAAAKPAADAVSAPEAPATVTKPKAAKAAKPAAAKPAASKPAAKKKAAAPKAPRKTKAPVAAAGFTNDDIALRAYFIAEARRHTGEHGTPEGDWHEAERQLRAELAK